MKRVDFVVVIRSNTGQLPAFVENLDLELGKIKQSYRVFFLDEIESELVRETVSKLREQYPVTYIRKDDSKRKRDSLKEVARLATSQTIVILDQQAMRLTSQVPAVLRLSEQHKLVLLESPFLGVLRREIVTYLPDRLADRKLPAELVSTAAELGYRYLKLPLPRGHRVSEGLSVITNLSERLSNHFSQKRPPTMQPKKKGSMIGAGVVRKAKHYITHTTLPHLSSALITFTPLQKTGIGVVALLAIAALVLFPMMTLKIGVAILSIIYFLDIFFNIAIISRSLDKPPEISIPPGKLEEIDESSLPVYSILCPLYKEGSVLPSFVAAMGKLDWPKDKLDIQLLLEEDDKETIEAAKEMALPDYFRLVIVPDSQPRTKPKACNYGLAQAKGEYLVIYDAEDIPEPAQLKKAYYAFQTLPADIKCLQAKLNYFNPRQNILTRLFSVEYSLWFDVTLPGLQTLNTMIPLGGTSNHFRTEDLTLFEGWDPFNVTEDADLGIRLFKKGYRTAIIDSITLEEANSQIKNWLRQRSRWIKGYMQTFLVHMRDPRKFMKTHGRHAFYFQMIIGGKLAFMLINPIMWALTISYFVLRAWVGPTIEALYPGVVFGMAFTSLVIGNFLFVFCYMIGVAKREEWPLMKFVYLQPFYWLFVSLAAGIALVQLFFRPHYWEKTQHGLHLAPMAKASPSFTKKIEVSKPKRKWSRGVSIAAFTAATAVTSLINFYYSIYLGRTLSLSDYGNVALVITLYYAAQILFTSYSRSVSYQTAYILGRYRQSAKDFWRFAAKRAVFWGVLATGLWLFLIGPLRNFFGTDSYIPIISFTPLLLTGFIYAADTGFVTGRTRYGIIASVILVEAIIKMWVTYLGVISGQSYLLYSAIPLSIVAAIVIIRMFITREKENKKTLPVEMTRVFPNRFFWTTIINRAAVLTILSADILAAKHFLSPESTGIYALLSTVGKIVFFAGSLFTIFIVPETAKEYASKIRGGALWTIFLTITASLTAVYIMGPLGSYSLPLIFGERAQTIMPYAGYYSIGMAAFTIATAAVTYFQAKREFTYTLLSLLITSGYIAALTYFHDSVASISRVTALTGVTYLVSVIMLRLGASIAKQVKSAGRDFYDIFERSAYPVIPPNKLRLLIFNWRDTKHVYAGGAEVYVQEIARQWVKQGHKVTIFSGNDGNNPRNEVVDGVQIIRRGGTYSVYLWAAVYYLLKLRRHFDILIDCENGIPFFTPLFSRLPKFLVVFHVHRNIFRKVLPVPLSTIARFMETVLVPLVYRNEKVITISPSSKKEIISTGLARAGLVEIIKPGVKMREVVFGKTAYPSFVYLGRLKKYKNVDLAIQAFAEVYRQNPLAKLTIAGTGEMRAELEKMVQDLSLESSISFAGYVSEEAKAALLQQAWAAVQPSSYEGWGLTVIEANAAGTPVIAANVPGLKDSVKDWKTGILVEKRTASAFAEAMLTITRDQQVREELSRAARIWATQFRWDASAKQFIEYAFATVRANRAESL